MLLKTLAPLNLQTLKANPMNCPLNRLPEISQLSGHQQIFQSEKILLGHCANEPFNVCANSSFGMVTCAACQEKPEGVENEAVEQAVKKGKQVPN